MNRKPSIGIEAGAFDNRTRMYTSLPSVDQNSAQRRKHHQVTMTESSYTPERHSNRRDILKVLPGVATTAVTVPVFAGNVTAHFPENLELDIKPESDDNRINADRNGLIPVAVLQTDEFDPTDQDVRYRFGAPDVVSDGGGARPAHTGHIEDVDNDGNDDLVLHFPTEDTGFDSDDEEGRIEWERTETGEHGRSGTDNVMVTETAAKPR